jgi:hypothetical protein
VTIPPGAHSRRSDVETFHNLTGAESFEREPLASTSDFLSKASARAAYSKAERRNAGKEWKTPPELVREKHPGAPTGLALFRPAILDDLAE